MSLTFFAVAFLPLSTALIIVFVPRNFFDFIYNVAGISATISLISVLFQLLEFDFFQYGYQKIFLLHYFTTINIDYSIAFDGISLWFVIINNLLAYVSIFLLSKHTRYIKFFLIIFFLLQFFIVQAFLVVDFFMFYIYFEAILIPMFFLIGIWGSYDRNLHAAFMFFLYTLLGSMILLLALQFIQIELGSTHFGVFRNSYFSIIEQMFLFFLIFIAFAIKIPMFPVHIWLPEAHGEAPTIGSMILAGVLLKLGLYGFIRVLLPICANVVSFLYVIPFFFALLSVLYTTLATIVQTDIKRVIAYSSIGHMNLAILGLFSNTIIGLDGAVFSSISHGFISPALFMMVGILYDRYGTKLILYFGKLVLYTPLTAGLMFILILANVAFPGLSSFVGELYIFISLVSVNFFVFLMASTSVIFVAVYNFWLFNRIFAGSINSKLHKFSDLTIDEFLSIMLFIFFIVLLGIFPNIIFNMLYVSHIG